MTLRTRLLAHIQEAQLLRPGDRVLIGVSGGPDSVALVRLLHTLRHDLGIHLHVAHYNHRWRTSADIDERFVKDLANACRIPVTMGRSRQRKSLQRTGSAEEQARQARLRFFKRVLNKLGGGCVVLAHTKDDLAETVLMRILRGTGLQGLRAMQPRTIIDNMTIIRPLLETQKEQLLVYLREAGIAFREDPTNRDERFLRNKIRRQLLPLLRAEYNTGIDDALVHLAMTLQADFELIDQQAEDLFQQYCKVDRAHQQVAIPIGALSEQSVSLRRLILRKIYAHLAGNTRKIGFRHIHDIEKILSLPGTAPATNWPGGITIKRGGKTLTFKRLFKA